jgi:hypothetical protein
MAGTGMLLLPACKKLVEVPDNASGQIVTSQVFTDSANATQGVIGMYTTATLSTWNPEIYTGLGADELLNNSTGNTAAVAFYQDSLTSGNFLTTPSGYYFWNQYYSSDAIYRANAALEGLTADNLLSTPVRNQLMGECKFMRAFYHFYLVNLFGDVPYITSSDYRVNERIPRIAVKTVYDNLEQELLQTRQLLLPAYPTTGRQRPNRYTADALLARLYLYSKQWRNAETRCDSILNSGLYALVPNLDNVFLDQSKEAIWQVGSHSPTFPKVAPSSGPPFLSAYSFIAPSYSLSSFVLKAFETGDLRLSRWVASSKTGTVTYTYPYKYKNISSSNPNNTTEDLMVFRLAEIYLIRAEARARQGNLAGAMQDISLIRSRAGLGAATAVDLAGAMGVILHERQTELFTEWGHRWLDLKRTDSINAVLGREKPWWPADGHAALYPIPYTELIYNPGLTQNPGY